MPKRKRQTDILFLRVPHIAGQENIAHGEQSSCSILYYCSKLPCIKKETMLLHGTGVSGYYV